MKCSTPLLSLPPSLPSFLSRPFLASRGNTVVCLLEAQSFLCFFWFLPVPPRKPALRGNMHMYDKYLQRLLSPHSSFLSLHILNGIPKVPKCAIMSWMDVAQVVFTWKEGSGFHGSNQTTQFLQFPLLRCLLRIWLDLVWVDFTVALRGRCVLCE